MTEVKFKDGHSVSQEPMLHFPLSMSSKVNLKQKSEASTDVQKA